MAPSGREIYFTSLQEGSPATAGWWNCPASGLSFLLRVQTKGNGDDLYIRTINIQVNVSGKSETPPYSQTLPFGLTRKSTREDVRSKLGHPELAQDDYDGYQTKGASVTYFPKGSELAGSIRTIQLREK
jgi:hypothetical protein